MKCFNHRKQDAIGVCIKCGKGLCGSCYDNSLPVVMCLSCSNNKVEAISPKPELPPAETSTTVTIKNNKMFPRWYYALIIFFVIVAAGILISQSELSCGKAFNQKTSTAETELQKKRLDFINELTQKGVFTKIENLGSTIQVWVTPLFNALKFDDKQSYIKEVYSYYHTLDKSGDLITIYDSKTGKQIGKYAPVYGGLVLE